MSRMSCWMSWMDVLLDVQDLDVQDLDVQDVLDVHVHEIMRS